MISGGNNQCCRIVLGAILLVSLTGCETDLSSPKVPLTAASPAPVFSTGISDTADQPIVEPLQLALEHFDRHEYGLAERYFRETVENAPNNLAAWIGLAASYDELRRFDLADRAYSMAIKLGGETVQVLNNEGYSYMLRGDLVTARKKLLAAAKRDPSNPMILNNLKLLEASKGTAVPPL